MQLEGPDGFVGLTALGSTANPPEPLTVICDNQAHHVLMPYGSQPRITRRTVAGQDACLILPSDDQDPTLIGQPAGKLRTGRHVLYDYRATCPSWSYTILLRTGPKLRHHGSLL